MAINRYPNKNFCQLSNSLADNIPANGIGIIYLFLRRPTGWKMRFEELLEHWSESTRSLRRSLKKLKEEDLLTIKPYYDKKKKRFAGSYYALKETNEEHDSRPSTDNTNKPLVYCKQRCTKSRGSAKAESLQNKVLINNNDKLYNNTDIKYIESNTYNTGEEETCDEEPEEKIRENAGTSKLWDAERSKLWDGHFKNKS